MGGSSMAVLKHSEKCVIHRAITIPLPNNGSGGGVHWYKLCTLEGCGYGQSLTWDWNEVTCSICKQAGILSGFISENTLKTQTVDKNDVELEAGDVIDIHQTVNGCSEFFIKSINPLDIYYNYDRSRKYEYDMNQLLSPCRFSGEVEFEIVKRETNVNKHNK